MDSPKPLSRIQLFRNSTPTFWRAAYVHGERTLAQQPIILPEDDFATLLHKKVTLEMEHLCTEGGFHFSAEERESIVDIVATYCDTQARHTTLRARKVLDTLMARGYNFVLVTNFYGNIRAVLQGYGLLDLFPRIVESATAGVRNPDPAIWQLGIDLAQRAHKIALPSVMLSAKTSHQPTL